MKKLLITLAAAGALALPVGAVLAQADDGTTDDTVTTVEPDRDQVRLRIHQEDGYAQCDGTQTQERNRIHVDDATGVGPQAQVGQGSQFGQGNELGQGNRLGQATSECSADCTGDQVRGQAGDAVGPTRDGAGIRMMYGNGRNG